MQTLFPFLSVKNIKTEDSSYIIRKSSIDESYKPAIMRYITYSDNKNLAKIRIECCDSNVMAVYKDDIYPNTISIDKYNIIEEYINTVWSEELKCVVEKNDSYGV